MYKRRFIFSHEQFHKPKIKSSPGARGRINFFNSTFHKRDTARARALSIMEIELSFENI